PHRPSSTAISNAERDAGMAGMQDFWMASTSISRWLGASVKVRQPLWAARYGGDFALAMSYLDGSLARREAAEAERRRVARDALAEREAAAKQLAERARLVTASSDATARLRDVWPLLTADTVAYAGITALRALSKDE